MHGEGAIDALELRESLFTIPGLVEIDTLTDDALYRIIERKTAIVLHHAGLDSLPAGGTISRGKINDAVHTLAFNEVRRRLRPEDPEVLRELNAEDQGQILSLEAIKEQHTGRGKRWGGGIVG